MSDTKRSVHQEQSASGKELAQNLFLRWSTPADTEKIATLTGHVFRDKADEPPNVRMMDQMRVIMRGDHPYMTPGDFAVVEDLGKPERPIVACTCLWQHRWSYGGIPFTAGRPEFVATDPDYRNRGLVRAIFDFLHERSDGRGDLMQGITGIPYFYRQFGYEMVLDLGGGCSALVNQIPEPKEDEPAPCRLRAATVEEVPLLQELHLRNRGESLLWHDADEAFWHYLVRYWDDPAIHYEERILVGINARAYMIVDATDTVLGMVVVGHHRWGKALGIYELALQPQTNLQTILPALLRALREHGLAAPTIRENQPDFAQLTFQLGRHHPIYELMGTNIAPKPDRPYAWYIRVPDVPAFVRHIAPLLEERLTQSVLTGHTGELLLDFYRGGLRLNFEQGKLVAAEPWRAPVYDDDSKAGFPPLVFLQLLLGYRSLDELLDIFPDVYANEAVRPLLRILFPKQSSVLMPMG